MRISLKRMSSKRMPSSRLLKSTHSFVLLITSMIMLGSYTHPQLHICKRTEISAEPESIESAIRYNCSLSLWDKRLSVQYFAYCYGSRKPLYIQPSASQLVTTWLTTVLGPQLCRTHSTRKTLSLGIILLPRRISYLYLILESLRSQRPSPNRSRATTTSQRNPLCLFMTHNHT